MASYVQTIRHVQRANVTAAILAIGTANPTNKMYQVDYPDYYFRVTNSEHMIDLKAKFKRICEKSMIRKRHMHLNEDMLKENPQFKDNSAASLKSRQVIVANEVPKLGYEAATKAINEWGQPKSKITHVVFGTNSCDGNMTGANYHFIKLLGLEPTVKHFIVRQGGCHAGCTVLRIAKDMAENNRGARVLVVCSEVTSVYFLHAPSKTHLVPQALFGDGAGAMVVGASPNEPTEQPIFHLDSTGQTTLPGSDWVIQTHLNEYGMVAQLSPDLPQLISKHIEKILLGSFNYLGINNWNSIFWVAHPGGPAILDEVEAELGLEASKLSTSRQVLSEYGNMLGASVMFIMDEMRKKSLKEGKVTTGEGFDWGVLCGFGPGITIETIVLRSVPLN